MSTTMKNLVVFYDQDKKLTTQLEDVPIPSKLDPHDILIKVSVAGSNPKDPLPAYFNNRLNQGDDCVGTIAAIGTDVRGFQVGERVAALHEMDTLNGSYAQFSICHEQTVFRVPDSTSDEEAATIPLTIFTAAVGPYRNLDIPAPWDRSDEKAPTTEKVPLVVNAASGAVGTFAIKLAKLNAKIGPIIAIAGSSADFVKSLGVDAVVDYRAETVADDIKRAAGGVPIRHVFDAANSLSSVKYLTAVLEKGGRYTCTMPPGPNPMYDPKGQVEEMLRAAGVWYEQIWVGEVHETKKAGGQLFGALMSKVIENALFDGRLKGHPFKKVSDGLNGVQAALETLRDRKGGDNAKFVTRISETEGLVGGA